MNAISVVIPCRNEAENLGALLQEIHLLCANDYDYEVIVVDDGSTDNTQEVLTKSASAGVNVRMYRNAKSAGQSAAIHTGVTAAKASIVCMLDGDGQNPPGEIPNLLAPFFSPDKPTRLGLVAGQRLRRNDSFSKRLASKVANGLRSFVLKDKTRDTGCGLKAFRRDAYLALPYFNHMHRYLPALFGAAAWEIVHIDVAHEARHAGSSNYSNLQRGLVGAVDLVGVSWLIHRRKKAVAVEIDLESVAQ